MDVFKKHYFGDMNEKNKKTQIISTTLYSLLGGISFVIIAFTLKLNIYSLNLNSIMLYILTIMYISALIIIAGIDKSNIKIEKKLLGFEVIVSMIYMIYMCSINTNLIYKYLIYVAIYFLAIVTDTILLRKFAKDSYTMDMLILLSIILMFSDVRILFYTIWASILAIIIDLIILKMRQKKTGNKKIKLNEIPIGFFICTSNIAIIYATTIITTLQA